MSIATMDDPGEFLPRSKVNEIIEAINALQAATTGGTVPRQMWATVHVQTGVVDGQSAGLSIAAGGNTLTGTFDAPFDSAGDYAVTCTCTGAPSSGDTLFPLLSSKSASGFVIDFANDDVPGGGGPSIAEITIMCGG